MKTLRIMLTLALVAIWPLVVSHCKLEQLPGFQFFACNDEETDASHSDDGCETDTCASVESGSYKPESGRLVVPAPPGTLSPFLTAILLESALPAADISELFGNASSNWTTSWQFSLRTALPVRAPSLVS